MSDIVYLITCTECKKYYVGETGRAFRATIYVYFVYLGFYVAFNTVQVISRRVVGRAEETST